MEKAFALAERGRNFTSPNPKVGCLIVKKGQIVGQGWHRAYGAPHAEVEAIKSAGGEASESTAYITLEPCNHHGKTPPCTDLIIKSGIKRVVYSVKDPGLQKNSSDILRAASIEVSEGVLRGQGEDLLAGYLKSVKYGKPLVTLKSGLTLDGKIASVKGKSRWISSPATRELTMEMRGEYDAILVGANTVNMDNPLLTYRLEDPPAKNPLRVIVDGRLSVREDARIIGENTLILTASEDTAKIGRLEDKGAEVISLDSSSGEIYAEDILRILHEKGVLSLLVEGGGETNWSFINSKEADKIFYILAPMILGGRGAPTPCGGTGFDEPSHALKLTNLKVSRCEEDIIVSADILK